VQVQDAAVEHAGVTLQHLKELAQLGSLYLRQMGSRKFRRLYDSSAPYTVLSSTLEAGDVLRIHTEPTMFAAACAGRDVLWKDRCRFIDPCFVVVDKPGGLPCSPHVSNAAHVLHRCMLRQFADTVEGESIDHLIPLHRLDTCSTGLVALARTKDAARAFSAVQAQDGPQGDKRSSNYLKIYRACFLAPLSGPPALMTLLEQADSDNAQEVQIRRWVSPAIFGMPAPRFVSTAPPSPSPLSMEGPLPLSMQEGGGDRVLQRRGINPSPAAPSQQNSTCCVSSVSSTSSISMGWLRLVGSIKL